MNHVVTMNRAECLIKMLAKSSVNGANWPSEGPVRVQVDTVPALAYGERACETVAEMNTANERVSVRVTCGGDTVASLEWLGKNLGWSLLVVEREGQSSAGLGAYLGRLRDTIEQRVAA